MRAYQHTAFTLFNRYDTLYGGHKSDTGVGSVDVGLDFFIDTDFAFLQCCEHCTDPPFQWELGVFPWGKAVVA
jgi:hypothetical protein